MPLPKGYTLDQPQADAKSSLPAGYTLDTDGSESQAPTQAQPNGAKDLVSSFGGSIATNFFQPIAGAFNAISHPYDTATKALNVASHPLDTIAGIGNAVSNAYAADHDARTRLYDRAEADFKVGDYGNAAIDAINGTIPFLGTVNSRMSDEIHNKDWKGLGNDLGDIVSTFAVPEAYGKLITGPGAAIVKKAAKPFSSPISESAAARTELGIDNGIGDYSDHSPVRRWATRFLGNRASGRGDQFEFLQGQNTQAQNAARSIASDLGPDLSPRDAGMSVADELGAKDAAYNQGESARVQSVLDAENNRVARINAEGQGGVDAANKFRSGLLKTKQDAQAGAMSNLTGTVDSIGELGHPEAIGSVAQDAISNGANAFRQEARQKYSNVDRLTNNLEPSIAPIKTFMGSLASDLKGIGGATASLKGVDVSKLVDTAEKFSNAPDTVSFSEAQDILSALKSVNRNYGSLIKSRYPGVINKLSGMLEGEMQGVAAKAGNGALEAYKDANSFYRQGAQLFNESGAADLMDKNPEQVASSLWKPNNITPIKEAKAAMAGSPEAWGALQRRGVEDLFEHSMSGGQLQPDKLLQNWVKLGKPVQQELAGAKWSDLNEHINHLAATHEPLDLGPEPSFKPVKADANLPDAKPQPLNLTPQQQNLRNIVTRSPETLVDRLSSDTSDSLWSEVKSSLPDRPDVVDSLRRNVFDKMITANSKTSVGGGSPILDGRALARHWESLPVQIRSHIAGSNLGAINKLMSAVNGIDTTKLNTLHHAISGGLLDVAGAEELIRHAVTGNYLGAAAAAAFLIAPKFISKAITTPLGRKWLTEGLSIPTASPKAKLWAAQAKTVTGRSMASQKAAHILLTNNPSPQPATP